jgi:hypothetical protein
MLYTLVALAVGLQKVTAQTLDAPRPSSGQAGALECCESPN